MKRLVTLAIHNESQHVSSMERHACGHSSSYFNEVPNQTMSFPLVNLLALNMGWNGQLYAKLASKAVRCAFVVIGVLLLPPAVILLSFYAGTHCSVVSLCIPNQRMQPQERARYGLELFLVLDDTANQVGLRLLEALEKEGHPQETAPPLGTSARGSQERFHQASLLMIYGLALKMRKGKRKKKKGTFGVLWSMEGRPGPATGCSELCKAPTSIKHTRMAKYTQVFRDIFFVCTVGLILFSDTRVQFPLASVGIPRVSIKMELSRRVHAVNSLYAG